MVVERVEHGPPLGGWEIAGIVAGMIAAGLAALAAWQATRTSKAAAESLRLAGASARRRTFSEWDSRWRRRGG